MRKNRDGLNRRNGIFGFRYPDKLGGWREKSCGTSDREEAKKFKRDFLKDLENDTLPTEKAEWTVEQACTRWVEQHAARICNKAQRNEKSYARQLIRRVGTLRLKAVTLDVLKDYQSSRLKEVAARPINCELTILIRT